MTTTTHAPEDRPSGRAADLEVRPCDRLRRRFERNIAPAERRALRRVAQLGGRCGIAVYLVGGVVRDLLLRRPVHDIDLAVDGDLDRITRELKGEIRVHDAFATATVRLPGGARFDLARTRRERYRRPAALPQVTPGDLGNDLFRRDFTINALAAPLLPAGPSGLIDPFGGLADLRGRRIRVLHERSFIDDPTRAFRAARIGAAIGFGIERGTAKLMIAAAGDGGCDRLSAARLRHEVERILESGRPGRAIGLLDRHLLLAALEPGLKATRPIVASLERLPAVAGRFRQRFPDEALSIWASGLALLLRSASDPVVRRTVDRLQPSRAERRTVLDGVVALRRLPRTLRHPRRPSEIVAACRGHTVEGLLSVLASTSSEPTRRAVLAFVHRLRPVRPDLTGRDLLRAGVRAGPEVARGLAAALADKLDGKASTPASQMRAALAVARRS